MNLHFQGIIRASVTQEHDAPQTKSIMPSLEIKLPALTEEARRKGPTSSIPTEHTAHRTEEEEEEEDEDDDWDAFQSFPASTSEVMSISKVESATEEPDFVEKASVSDIDYVNENFQEHMGPMPPNKIAESIDEDRTAVDAEMTTDSLSGRHPLDEHVDCPEASNDHHEEKTEAAGNCENDQVSDIKPVAYPDEYTEELGDHHQERDGTVAADKGSDPASSDLASIEDTKGSVQTYIPDDESTLPEISGSDVSKHPGETDDRIHREQNAENDAAITSEIKGNNKSTEVGSEDETEKTEVVSDTAKS